MIFKISHNKTIYGIKPVMLGVIFLYYDCPVTAPFKNFLQRSTEENLKNHGKKMAKRSVLRSPKSDGQTEGPATSLLKWIAFGVEPSLKIYVLRAVQALKLRFPMIANAQEPWLIIFSSRNFWPMTRSASNGVKALAFRRTQYCWLCMLKRYFLYLLKPT